MRVVHPANAVQSYVISEQALNAKDFTNQTGCAKRSLIDDEVKKSEPNQMYMLMPNIRFWFTDESPVYTRFVTGDWI